jgi:carboxypeptidase Taq
MQQTYQQLAKKFEELGQLEQIMGILHWDQEVIMPSGATQARAEQIASLAGVAHEKQTDGHIGELLDQLEAGSLNDLDPYERCNIREIRREYDRQTKVPMELVQEIAELGSRGHHIWAKAREENKYSDFAPVLERLIELRKQWTHHIEPNKPPYDVLMDIYERGLTVEQVDPIFERLKVELVPLIRAIQESDYQPDTSFLQGEFSISSQEALGRTISEALGFDFDKGRMDVSVHPFCGGADPTDVRITTRYGTDNFMESLFAVIHETGHAMYEQGRMERDRALPVSEALTTGIHESQSLFWERMISKQKAFCEHYMELFTKTFPDNLKGVDVQAFYEAINICRPSFIRVESDEVTYPMHIILRYEIEKGIFDGTYAVSDLPEVWNNKMQEYLGIRPATDTDGILQDVHWSGGAFGYFPSYTFGAMYACQFYNAMKQETPDLENWIREGRFQSIKQWLTEKIHVKGKLLSTEVLLKEVTGEILNPTYFTTYLKNKYHEIYRLSSTA